MKKISILVVVIAIIVAAYAFLRPAALSGSAATQGDADSHKQGASLAASAVLKINPSVRSIQVSAPRSALPPVSPFTQAFLERKDWAGLYRRLQAAPVTPETQFLQAEILMGCAKRPPPKDAPARKEESREERHSKFLASLPANDPNLERRKAAWEQMSVDKCGELAQLEYNAEAALKLVQAASAGGDPRAKSWLLAKQLEDAEQEESHKPAAERKANNGYVMTDAQFATMRELLASQDPMVIEDLRGFIASSIDGSSLRIGPDQLPIDHQAMFSALALVGCDFGAACGKDSPSMLYECAAQGRCSAETLYDHTYFYGVSPNGAQLVEQYRQWLGQMISARDLSQFNLVRTTSTPNSTWGFRMRQHK